MKSRGLLHAAAERVAARPAVYNLLQRVFGQKKNAERVARVLAECDGRITLDVGAGTGMYRDAIPQGWRYMWLDEDPLKLRGFRSRGADDPALLGDATHLGIADRCVEVTLCSGLSHHLPDDEVSKLFAELARVTKDKLVFLDAIDDPRSRISRMLWSVDRGSYPRTEGRLLELLGRSFAIESHERFKPAHTFVLCVCRPQRG